MRVSFRSFDETELRGEFFIPQVGSKPYPTVCLCHGIPIKPRAPGDRGYAEVAELFCELGMAALTFNFRGTGESEGEFDLLAWTADMEAGIDYLYNDPLVDKARLGVAGFSGGALVSLYVASRDLRIKALALCSIPGDTSRIPPSAMEESIKQARASGSLRGVERAEAIENLKKAFELLNPRNYIGKISPRPLLILHGSLDELFSLKEVEEVFHEALEPKELVVIEGAPHKIRLHREAMERLASWFKRLWLR